MRELLGHAEAHASFALDLVRALAAIDTGTGQSAGIREAGALLAQVLEALGFSLETVPAKEFGQHLVARRSGTGRPLLMIGHLDTIHAPGAARAPRLDGDRLAGPGVYDCKGGLALCLATCRLWAHSSWPQAPLTLIINADEEVGSPSSRPLIEAEAGKARAALIVEPAPNLESVIVSRKGIGRYVLRVFGKAAHAGANHEAGINAVVELAAKISALERLNATADGFVLTVGTVAGGIKPNVIPDYAQAELDLRLAAPEHEAAALASLAAAAAVSQVPGASYRLEGGITRPPMPANAANGKLFAMARQSAAVLGLNLTAFNSGGGSDGNFCAATGLPTLDGLGPAGGGAHAEDEHILCSSLAPRIALLADLGRRIAEALT